MAAQARRIIRRADGGFNTGGIMTMDSTRTRALLLAMGAGSVLGQFHDSGGSDEEKREPTTADLERIEAARQKRERKRSRGKRHEDRGG